jgi:membrane-bound acyltransferase YfiQ involved in biofilm formation
MKKTAKKLLDYLQTYKWAGIIIALIVVTLFVFGA